jgi:hypothetical protein
VELLYPTKTNAFLLQGANNQGIKEHIKVKKKQDAFGVGAVSRQAHLVCGFLSPPPTHTC